MGRSSFIDSLYAYSHVDTGQSAQQCVKLAPLTMSYTYIFPSYFSQVLHTCRSQLPYAPLSGKLSVSTQLEQWTIESSNFLSLRDVSMDPRDPSNGMDACTLTGYPLSPRLFIKSTFTNQWTCVAVSGVSETTGLLISSTVSFGGSSRSYASWIAFADWLWIYATLATKTAYR